MNFLTIEQKLENLNEVLAAKKVKLQRLQEEVQNVEKKISKLEAKKAQSQ